MKRSKNLLRKGAALAAMSTVLVSQAPLINAFAYGEADVSQSTFKQDTDNSADFQNWLSNVWQGGEKAYQFVGNSEARIVCLRMAYQCVGVWRLACVASGVI